MQVVHEADGETETIATDVELADSFLAQTKGMMGRSEVPEGFAMVFRFGRSGFRGVHMLFVKVPLDVLWVREGEVTDVATLSPWTGLGFGFGDTLVELPAGAAAGVSVGDAVRVEDGGSPPLDG